MNKEQGIINENPKSEFRNPKGFQFLFTFRVLKLDVHHSGREQGIAREKFDKSAEVESNSIILRIS